MRTEYTDPVYLIRLETEIEEVMLDIKDADEIRKLAGVPEDTPWDDRRIQGALLADGWVDYADFANLKDRIEYDYEEQMAQYIAACIEDECADYNVSKDCETRYPLCKPWLSDEDWLTPDMIEGGEYLTNILDDLAYEAVKSYKEEHEDW